LSGGERRSLRPVAAGRCSWGQPRSGRCRSGWEQPRQSRDGQVPPDGVGPASVTKRSTRGTSVGTFLKGSPAPIWRIWAGCGAYPSEVLGGELRDWHVDVGPGGHGEVLRGSCGDAARTELGSSFVERIDSEHGNRLGPRPSIVQPTRGVGLGSVVNRSVRAAVVLRAGESPCTWGRAAAVPRSKGGCNARERSDQ